MKPFSVAVDVCFTHLGVAAVYVPNGGVPKDVQVIAKRPDAIVGFGDTRVHTGTAVFEVRVSDVAVPRPGDRLAVDGSEYVIQGEPVRDPERLVWTLETYPA